MKNKPYEIRVVRGSSGFSLQANDEKGGLRVLGPKAWGNPYSNPTCLWKLSADEAKELVEKIAAVFNLKIVTEPPGEEEKND